MRQSLLNEIEEKMARFQIKATTENANDAIVGIDVDHCSYDDGVVDDSNIITTHIKSFRLRIALNQVRLTVKRYLKTSSQRLLTIHEKTTSKITSQTSDQIDHKFKLHQTKDGYMVLLFDGKPIQAQEITMRGNPVDHICVDIKGIYLKEIDIDIDSLNQV